MENLERRKAILIGEIRRLEAELKRRSQKLRESVSHDAEALDAAKIEISPEELQREETKLLDAANDIDLALGEARKVSGDLGSIDSGESLSSTWKVLEGLDRVLFKKEDDEHDSSSDNSSTAAALFVICPRCREKVDAKDCLRLRKKKGVIMLACNSCDEKTGFSLPSLVGNMIEAN